MLDESPNESEIPAKRWIRRLKHPGVFLTYDDGPNPAVTPQLLDLLREFGASATFFVTGESLDHPEAASLLKRTLAEGHTIGNHGQIHSKGHDPEFEISRFRIENPSLESPAPLPLEGCRRLITGPPGAGKVRKCGGKAILGM